jgi:uncharacterized protein (DUF2267 family)
MSELSPAAQAVLEASAERWAGTRTQAIAAALRAAVDQIENLYCDGNVDDSPGIVFALRQLILIANEFETQ